MKKIIVFIVLAILSMVTAAVSFVANDIGSYRHWIAENKPAIMENSGLMCLHFLLHIGMPQVVIAGLDGYDICNHGNYVNSGLEYDFSAEQLKERNELIAAELNRLQEKMQITFLTDSIYKK